MNTMTKRCTTLTLALIMLFTGIYVPLKKAEAAVAYNNCSYAVLNCGVNSSGKLNADLDVTGIKGVTTRINVELYVEKRVLLIFWTRVSIGYPNDVWTDSTTSYIYSNTFSTNLSSAGTYRVTVTYTVKGSGGADDVITRTDTVTY